MFPLLKQAFWRGQYQGEGILGILQLPQNRTFVSPSHDIGMVFGPEEDRT